MSFAEKHKTTIDESTARLLARATDSRLLKTEDLQPRISASIEKYVLRDNENASSFEIKEFFDALNADDLCLIIACEKGVETAWNDLVKNFDSTVKSAARKITSNAEDAEDLASSIWAELYGLKKDSSGKLKTKLAYYSGRGSLAGWLRAVVAQLAVDQFRKDSRFVQVEESREFENLAQNAAEKHDESAGGIVHKSETPEEVFSAKESQTDVSNALREAISNLAAEDRLILKLYYFDSVKLKDIGAALGFHEATASRKLARVQSEIRKSVEAILREKHGWQKEEIERFLAETASKLDLSVEKLFAFWLFCLCVQELSRGVVL